MVSHIVAPTWSLIAILVALACAKPYSAGDGEPEGLSTRLRPDIFAEYGEVIDVMVGVRATRYRDRSQFIPVEIAVANHGPRGFILVRDAITLVDAAGAVHRPVAPRELLQSYRFLDIDRDALSDLAVAAAGSFRNSTRQPSKLSPTRAVESRPFEPNVVQDTAFIPRFRHIVDFVYFPNPATRIRGQTFDITVRSPDLAEPIGVRVRVR